MKAEFERKCSAGFELQNVISKKEKIKDNAEMKQNLALVSDFFRRIFVIDAKKRMTFADISQHELLSKYQSEIGQNIAFYRNIGSEEETRKMKDDNEYDKNGQAIDEMEIQDESRSALIQKTPIDNKLIER